MIDYVDISARASQEVTLDACCRVVQRDPSFARDSEISEFDCVRCTSEDDDGIGLE